MVNTWGTPDRWGFEIGVEGREVKVCRGDLGGCVILREEGCGASRGEPGSWRGHFIGYVIVTRWGWGTGCCLGLRLRSVGLI